MALSRDELAKTLKPLVISWIQAGGTIGPYAPANAHFVTTQLETSLTAESVLTAGTLISVSTATVSLASGTVQYQYPVTGAGPGFAPAWSDGYLNITAAKTLTVSDSTTLANASITLANTGSLTLPAAATTITGGGTLALGGFTQTFPATGTTALATGIAGGQTIYGGTAANDDLTLEGTSHATKTTSYILLQPTGGLVGIGTTAPETLLHIVGGDIRAGTTATGRSVYSGDVVYFNDDSGNDYMKLYGYWGHKFVTSGASNAEKMRLSSTGGLSLGNSYVTIDPGAGNMIITGRVGIGTTTPDRKSHTEVSDAITAAITYATRTSHTTSGAAAALFGVSHEDELEDAAGNMQVASEAVTLWAAATSGQESPLYRITTYPTGTAGPGYCGFWTWNGVNGTARTMIPNGTGDVTAIIRVMYTLVLVVGGNTISGEIAATPGGGAVDLYNAGGEQFILTVAADGSVTVQRAAGTDTAKVVLLAVWI